MEKSLIKIEKKAIKVGVLAFTIDRFDQWVKQNKKDGETYHCIRNAKDARGKRFDRIEKSYLWNFMENSIYVELVAIECCRNPKQ